MNYVNELTNYFNAKYNLCATTCEMFANQGMFTEAEQLAKDAYQQVMGATYFMVGMLNENGCSIEAGEILDLWNGAWDNNFRGLIEGWTV